MLNVATNHYGTSEAIIAATDPPIGDKNENDLAFQAARRTKLLLTVTYRILLANPVTIAVEKIGIPVSG